MPRWQRFPVFTLYFRKLVRRVINLLIAEGLWSVHMHNNVIKITLKFKRLINLCSLKRIEKYETNLGVYSDTIVFELHFVASSFFFYDIKWPTNTGAWWEPPRLLTIAAVPLNRKYMRGTDVAHIDSVAETGIVAVLPRTNSFARY